MKYTANGFVEKNVESLSTELKLLGVKSYTSIVKEIFEHSMDEVPGAVSEGPSPNRPRSSIRGVSVACQFKTSLQNLVQDLEETQPHYIRCIKPNLKKASNDFNAGEVLRQLRYAGMMEAIRIRREGYSHREAHESFYHRFSILLDSKELEEGEDIAHLVRVLSKRLNVTDADWQIGHSKIFLRQDLAAKLDKLVSIRIRCAARIMGRFGRFVAQRRASGLLTSWMKLRLYLINKKRRISSASNIQATFRMTKQRLIFTATLTSVILIQSYCRRYLALKAVEKMRDPYGDLSFTDIEKVYNEEMKKLEEAIAKKKYDVAAALEESM